MKEEPEYITFGWSLIAAGILIGCPLVDSIRPKIFFLLGAVLIGYGAYRLGRYNV